MSGDLQITAGGAIAVDPGQMREVADRMAATAGRMTAAADELRRAHRTLSQTWGGETRVDLGGLWATAQRLADDGEALSRDATGTGIMADAFELADLRARYEMLSVRSPHQAETLQSRIDDLLASYPELDAMAVQLTAAWERSSMEGLFERPVDRLALAVLQVTGTVPLWLVGPMLHRGTTALGALQDRVAGDAPPPVRVKRVSVSSVDGAAVTLTQLAGRIPGGKAQVAVEKRTHADGAVSYTAYIDGTRTLTSGGEDPWDMGSNWDLYVDREQSAAYAATVEALRQAGAEPGARVDLVGYSQGGAIAAALAVDDVYETSRVMIIGSPTVPSLDADQALIRVVHTDDPVGAGLTSGGPAAGSGSPEGFTVSRDYVPGVDVTSVVSHLRATYDETIARADGSGDVRVTSMLESLRAEAAEIVSVQRMAFQASRP
ncbi:hypothetical protein AB0N64_09850 [Microbacterium sp. NPDC089318]